MSKVYLTYIATPIVLGLVTLSLGATCLMAQEHIRQPVVEVPAPQDHSTILEVHIRQPALDDATIVALFDNANTADIETGKLASQRGHSSEVRQFGAMLALQDVNAPLYGPGNLGARPLSVASSAAHSAAK